MIANPARGILPLSAGVTKSCTGRQKAQNHRGLFWRGALGRLELDVHGARELTRYTLTIRPIETSE